MSLNKKVLLIIILLLALIPAYFTFTISYYTEDQMYVDYANQGFSIIKENYANNYFRPLINLSFVISQITFGDYLFSFSFLIFSFFILIILFFFRIVDELYGVLPAFISSLTLIFFQPFIMIYLQRFHVGYFLSFLCVILFFYRYIILLRQVKLRLSKDFYLFILTFALGALTGNVFFLSLPIIILYTIYKKGFNYYWLVFLLALISISFIFLTIDSLIPKSFGYNIHSLLLEFLNPFLEIISFINSLSMILRYFPVSLFILFLFVNVFKDKIFLKKSNFILTCLLLVLLEVFFSLNLINSFFIGLPVLVLLLILSFYDRTVLFWFMSFASVIIILPRFGAGRQIFLIPFILFLFLLSYAVNLLLNKITKKNLFMAMMIMLILVNLLLTVDDTLFVYSEIQDNTFDSIDELIASQKKDFSSYIKSTYFVTFFTSGLGPCWAVPEWGDC